MLAPTLVDAIEAIRSSTPPAGMRTRIVAIDGLGGSGKSSLGRALARAVDGEIVHTDDFASWETPLEWWPNVIEQVLEPLTSGRAARYTPTSWGGPPKLPVLLEPGGLVFLEGVSSSRAAFRPYLAYSIWVETRRELRLQRGLERDGDEALPDWERWMAEEDAFARRERPAEHADLVLPGDADLWR
jgi:uridine kinase